MADIVQWHSQRRVAACVLLLFCVKRRRKNRKRWRKRLIWTKPYISRNPSLGVYNTLVQEIRAEDTAAFKNFLRMDQNCFDEQLEMVKPHIQKQDTNMRKSISAGEKLALTLRYLATGESFTSLHYAFRIGTSTISDFVPEVCQAIYQSLQNNNYLQVPSSEEDWKEIANGFMSKWNFPNCLGALDGKHIAIKAPEHSGSMFFNYKGFFSIVLLALVDADYKFTIVDVGSNGRISDGGVLRESNLQAALDTNSLGIPPATSLPGRGTPVPYVIVADEAFPLKENLMKPFPAKSLDDALRVFNYRLSRARRVSENAFGILVHRFQIFQSTIPLEPEKVVLIVLAAVALHNYLRTKSVEYSQAVVDSETEAHELVPGEWRHNPNAQLPSVCLQGSNRSSSQAREIREEFLDYFITNGQVDWQWDMI